MRSSLFFVVVATLTACAVGSDAGRGGAGSNAASVETGMTEQQVAEILGEFESEEFDPSSGDDSCRSYRYGDTRRPKYVIVRFQDRKVVSVSDGHAKPCEFRGDTYDSFLDLILRG